MKKLNFIIVIFVIILSSCQNDNKDVKNDNIETNNENVDNMNKTSSILTKIDATEIPDNVIKLIGQDWMLITAGNKDSFNTMTASWGGLGEMWGKHVSMITVRDIRYTYEFLEKNESYTLSFFTEDYKGALQICGSKSGRDTDKIKESGLTPKVLESGLMGFEQARLIIECKKLYAEPIKAKSFIDRKILDDFYTAETAMHTLYIGEITNVWIKK